MNHPAGGVSVDRCPLCASTRAAEHSIPPPNLYSEKLAALLGKDEDLLLKEHPNWRCSRCGLVYKRRWFTGAVLRELFSGAVGAHPRGWDAVLELFSPSHFRLTLDRWASAVAEATEQDVRRGERELRSIIGAVVEPKGFDPEAVVAAIDNREVGTVRAESAVIAASIANPVAFSRFTGFRSPALWEYLQDRTGGFRDYAEVGCPLWGLLPLAAASGVGATYLAREEINYWGAACINSGERCLTRLLGDRRIRMAEWSDQQRHALVGVFQYLDHPRDPVRFLSEVFGKADAAAIILDAMDSPVAIQHLTGWTDEALAYAAELFGKRIHTDFDDIRPSGNRLYLFVEGR